MANEVTRFIESIRDATRVLDAYTDKVKEAGREREKTTRSQPQSGGMMGEAAGAVGAAAESAALALAAKLATVALGELSAMASAASKQITPGLTDEVALIQARKIAKAETKEYAERLSDQGFAITPEMAVADRNWRVNRLLQRREANMEVERATGNTGDSYLFEHFQINKDWQEELKAQKQSRSHR